MKYYQGNYITHNTICWACGMYGEKKYASRMLMEKPKGQLLLDT
jgi:hypothetical protein